MIYALFCTVGLCLGSFANVLIHRWPQGKSILQPLWSQCPRCGKALRWWMNIPVISILWLRFRCFYCSSKIGAQYLIVEILMGGVFALVYHRYGWTFTTLEYCFFSWGIITASVIDIHHTILPDRLTLSGIVFGLVGAWLSPERDFLSSLYGFAIGFGFLWFIAELYAFLKKQEGMGGGDIKLIGWIGAYLGWKSIPFTIFASSLMGSVVGLAYIAITKKDMQTTGIPFGPYLSLAALIFLYFQPISLFFP